MGGGWGFGGAPWGVVGRPDVVGEGFGVDTLQYPPQPLDPSPSGVPATFPPCVAPGTPAPLSATLVVVPAVGTASGTPLIGPISLLASG